VCRKPPCPYNFSNETIQRIAGPAPVYISYYSPIAGTIPHLEVDRDTLTTLSQNELGDPRRKRTEVIPGFYKILQNSLHTLASSGRKSYDQRIEAEHENTVLAARTQSGQPVIAALAEQINNRIDAEARYEDVRARHAESNIKELANRLPDRPRSFADRTLTGKTSKREK